VAAKLTHDERVRLTRAASVAPEVYETYLRGLQAWNKRTEAGMREGLAMFEKAIALDPEYAPAYLGVCSTYATLGYTGWGAIAPREAMPKAQSACREALRLDDTLAAAHANLGSILAHYDWDRAAEASFARALSVGPSDQLSIQRYAWILSTAGRHDEALAESARAAGLDPLSVSAQANHGWLLYWARRYDQAAEQFARILALHPDAPVPNLMLGIVYLNQGKQAEAIAQVERALRMSGMTAATLAQLGHVYAVGGREAEARRVLKDLLARAKREYVASYWIALVHHGLGQNDEALALLEKAFADREALPLLDVEPRWDALRADPRFRDLQRRVGFRKPS
jgi:tetratricopeptide (TPR) repeat protein